MSTIESPLQRTKTNTRVADFMAFVGDRQTEQTLKNFVTDGAMPHAHIAIGSINDAITYIAKVGRSPLLLLVDLQGLAMPLSDLARLADVCEPSVQVIALGDRNDVGLYRSLLKIGIRDYLIKPLTVELLKRTVDLSEGKVNPVTLARAGKTIAIVGTRGGVGVTTVAVNLARHLADDTHRRIAYVDLNIHGGAANSMLGLQSNNGLADVLENVHRLDPGFVERTMISKGDRLFVLSSELPYGGTGRVASDGLAQVLELLTDSFHYVILDVGNRADPLAEEAFDHASRAYIIADRSVYSARETIRLVRHIEDRNSNPMISIVLNNPNAVTTGKVQQNDFLTAIGRTVVQEIAFESKALAVAENIAEAPTERSAAGFHQSIVRIGSDLTGQHEVIAQGLLRKLGWKR
jgi:pilus assembly protein CpaE